MCSRGEDHDALSIPSHRLDDLFDLWKVSFLECGYVIVADVQEPEKGSFGCNVGSAGYR